MPAHQRGLIGKLTTWYRSSKGFNQKLMLAFKVCVSMHLSVAALQVQECDRAHCPSPFHIVRELNSLFLCHVVDGLVTGLWNALFKMHY